MAAEKKKDAKKEAKKKGKKEKLTGKTLCKLIKGDLLDDSLKSYRELVNKGKFLCRKCGRVASDKKNLCKAVEL